MTQRFFVPRIYSPIYIHSVLYDQVGKGWSYKKDQHPLFEIMYCRSGSMTEWIDGRAYRLRPGDAVFINSGAVHSPEADEDSVFLNFHFDVELLDLHALFCTVKDPVLSGPEAENPRIRAWMERLIRELPGGRRPDRSVRTDDWRRIVSSIHQLRLQSLLHEFIGFLAAHFAEKWLRHAQPISSIPPSKRKVAHEVAALLEQGGEESRLISELAERLNVHRTSVTNSFKSVYKMTPKQYQTQIRIRKAKEMLQDSTLPVCEIAERLSFSSPGHFCNFFRTHVGTSPLQFRLNLDKAPRPSAPRRTRRTEF
jgi:AraC-like DNA-binding protein